MKCKKCGHSSDVFTCKTCGTAVTVNMGKPLGKKRKAGRKAKMTKEELEYN